jgi:CelD/BcsL family acetyltransferase involved in cellulose biosynthesis
VITAQNASDATQVRLLRPGELSAELVAAWAEIQESDPALASPYFRPEFTAAVAAVRDDVEVAVLEQAGERVGFFPFQRGAWNVGRPVGGRLSDYHGVVLRQGASVSAADLLRGCRLASWHFDHVPRTQATFAPFHETTAISPYLDLSEGFDAYYAARRAGGSEEVAHTLRKWRKLAREVGPPRLEVDCREPAVLEQLIQWKREQYARTGFTDLFSFPWTRALVDQILARREAGFAGMLSALYVGDRLIAAHLGMRSRCTIHWWFPAYDRELQKYSPGLQLLVRAAQEADSIGVRYIDLGKGDEQYKLNFMSGSTPLAEGAVVLRPLDTWLRRGWNTARRLARGLPREGAAGLPVRIVRRMREWMSFW